MHAEGLLTAWLGGGSIATVTVVPVLDDDVIEHDTMIGAPRGPLVAHLAKHASLVASKHPEQAPLSNYTPSCADDVG